jgi:hypothetical protein
MQSFKSQDFSGAIRQLRGMLNKHGPSLRTELFAERATYLLDHPPGADWDGVTKFETK